MTSDERAWRERGLRDAVRAGDEAAWKTLYQESFAALYAYVLWRCAGLRDAADEVVQDAWLTAVRRIGRFDPARGCFADWLCGIAANLLRNHFRRERVRRNSGAYATRLACLLNRPPTASGPSALPCSRRPAGALRGRAAVQVPRWPFRRRHRRGRRRDIESRRITADARPPGVPRRLRTRGLTP